MKALPVSFPVTLPLHTFTEAAFFRICKTMYSSSEPGFRAAGTYRFDSPDQSFGTLYCARNFKTCFFETIVRDRPDLKIPAADYNNRSAVQLLLDTLKLRLVTIHGDGAQTLRLNLAELAGADYTYPQALAKAIHDHGSEPHGMVYRSRFDDDALAMVLFERAKPHVRIFPCSTPVALLDAKELGDAIRNTVPFILV
jgi:hypothetical protein